jgi:GT2 family glycosyltransferase
MPIVADSFVSKPTDGNISVPRMASEPALQGRDNNDRHAAYQAGHKAMAAEQRAQATRAPLRVSVSMVTFNSSFELLNKTLDGLVRALRYAREQGLAMNMQLLVVDNSLARDYQERARDFVLRRRETEFDSVEFWHPGSNIGYGAAHNKALKQAQSDFHIILNPDVELAQDALYKGLGFLAREPEVVIVSPRATDASGKVQYLCKRYPSVFVLTLRAFAPETVKHRFRRLLHDYEIRDAAANGKAADVPLVSGCCMYARTEALRRAGGFSDRFFMYFEDFDLSMRLQTHGRLVYLPSVHIVHHGGYSARKGFRHITMFVHSGWKFFRRHGWCWI